MRNMKKLMSFALVLVMLLSTSVAFAADGDVYLHATNEKYASSLELTLNESLAVPVVLNESGYYYELDGEYYEVSDLFAAFAEDEVNFKTILKSDYQPIQVGDLAVVDITAINESTIEVTFSEAVDAAVEANFSLSKGTLKSVSLNAAKTVATLSVEGLTFGDTLDVTVQDVMAGTDMLATTTMQVTVPAFGALYNLVVTSDNAAIKADGLSKTMVTARILNKVTNEYVKEQGQVSFTTTKGDFAQSQVSFDQNGVAALQLTSDVSTEDVIAYITATVTSVPGATQYEGLVGQYQVKFVVESGAGELDMVAMINASSSQADRINVEFNAPVTVEQIIAQYPTLAAARADNFGFRVDEPQTALTTAPITNIEQVSSKVIRLILDTDNKFAQGTTGTTEVRYDYLAGTGSNYDAQATANDVAFNGAFLRDNMTHNVSIPANGTKVLMNSDGVNFVLTDISKPWIKGVNVVNQMEIEVEFSEAMAEDITELTEVSGGVTLYKNFRIDGKRLMPMAGITSTTAERATATNNNYLLVRASGVNVNEYWDGATPVDRRNVVTISIDPWNKLAPGMYSVQASNVGDWAAMTHSANMLVTQTFDFEVEGDTSVPKVTIDVHSPEQWLLTFDKPVKVTDTKAIQDAIKIYTKEEYAETIPTALTMTNAVAPAAHYQVTAVDDEGQLVGGTINGYLPTANVTNVQRLLIEFKQDWTAEYDTANTNINYFHSTKNPYVVVLDHWEDNVTDNAMGKTVLTASTPLDAKSPEIANATDVFELPGKTKRGVTSTETGQFVFVEMDEPVQLRNAGDTIVTTPLTESQQQFAGAGIPIPTFEFVKGDTVIPGSIVAGSIPQDDFDFVVEPDLPLEAGTWTLIIRSISDDVGNTSATVTRQFVVKEGVKVNTDTRVSWMGFDNANSDYDYVFIKFTKEMKSTGANGVARTTNYTLNNNPLPTGSEVLKGIKDWEGNATYGNVTNDWDGVTIKMPANAWDGTKIAGNTDFTLVFGVASNFEAIDGEQLSTPYTVQLNHVGDNSTADADFDFEAVYINPAAAVTNLVNDDLVAGAEAYDTDTDGEIETISLYDRAGTQVAGAANEEILVNGVRFVSDGTDYIASTPLKTTDSRGFKITSTTGAIIVNQGNVIDLAAPVIIKAKGQVGSRDVVLTFSEKVTNAGGNTVPFVAGDFSYGEVNAGGGTALTTVDSHSLPLTQITVVTDADLVAGDIGSDTIDINGINIVDLAETPNVGTQTTPITVIQ